MDSTRQLEDATELLLECDILYKDCSDYLYNQISLPFLLPCAISWF